MERIGTAANLPRVCVVSPCFNEEAAAAAFHAELARVFDACRERADFRVLYVDDGSRDGTLAVLNGFAAADPRVRVLGLARNFGQQAALTAGVRAARADAIVMMDSDLQHPPALIPQLLDAWETGHDVVWADRQRTEASTWWKRATSEGFHWLFNQISPTYLPPGAADFCLLSRRAARALARMPERHRFLRGMVAWMGFPYVLVPYVAPPRVAGESKYTMRRMLRLAQDAALSFTGAPAKIATRLGAAVAALALLGGAAALALLAGAALWTALGLAALALLQGAALLAIGVLGEYIVRIYDEVKGRPLYVVKQPPRRRAVAAQPATDAARRAA